MNLPFSPYERANQAQREASDPAVSAFVAASAGSGKTKLLTDRLLRLMLGGVSPERIQCLTFTRAAAAEMAVRLQRTLGSWVTLGDEALDRTLSALAIPPAPEVRQRARALFAQVLDLPGGMRIGTIHAFCQSLLRRFPLEAELPPQFLLIDERNAADALTEARETMLAEANSGPRHAALYLLAGLTSADQFGRCVDALQSDRPRLTKALRLGDLAAAQRRALGVTASTETEILADAVNWEEECALRAAAQIVQQFGTKGCAERAGRILAWLSLDAATRARRESWARWSAEFLTEGGRARAAGSFVNKAIAARYPELIPLFQDESRRVQAVSDACRGLAMAKLSAALLTLAAPVLQAYAAGKAEGGLVDYDDLIGRTSQLLADPGAAWVLYKLDGGLDHLLLDEVQDMAPAQWKIAHALTEEFFAGSGARELNRTVFAVGDRKQSIYSFQGADAEEFDRSRASLQRRVRGAGKLFRNTPLDVSFRSTQVVLDLVDAVFADPVAAAGVVEPGARMKHHAARGDHAGSVELWPLAPLPDVAHPAPWSVADTNASLHSAPQELAETLARWIHRETSDGARFRPGDVLVLVQRRNAFARALVRALKSRGVPVTGLDRLVLTDQPAVQDLMALADALLLPQDDLAFACLLTSPLGGLHDDDLIELTKGRSGALFEALRTRAHKHPRWQQVWDFFTALQAQVDYASPYALFSEALGPLGGRAKLFARLGLEAAEPVDELLSAALSYTRLHPPSLQGFLHWLRRSGAEVKREAEPAGNQVRIRTVHGAKGLQAPLVILPDTTRLPPDEGTILWAEDPATQTPVPLFAPRKEFCSVRAQRIRDGSARRRREEYNRLLYVALTRAETHLIVCGWRTRRGPDETCWYNLVARGFARLPTERVAFPDLGGDLLRVGFPERAFGAQGSSETAGVVLPAWLGRAPLWRSAPPPREPNRPQSLAPSRPQGIEFGDVPAAGSPLLERGAPEVRFLRGRLLHTLLQHLPALPRGERAAAARRWLDRWGARLPDGTTSALVEEALNILDHPELRAAFGPDSRAEVPLSGVLFGRVVGGLVDRLAVLPDRVVAVDFKTNRLAPAQAEDTPVMYLRQMAAYRAVLRGIFPGRMVQCALVWTRACRVTILADELLDAHTPNEVGPVSLDPTREGSHVLCNPRYEGTYHECEHQAGDRPEF